MRKHTTFVAVAAALLIACVGLGSVLLFNDASDPRVRLRPGSAEAQAPQDREYGYLDQWRGTYVLVQLNVSAERAGAFVAAVPGVGVFTGGAPANLAVSQDGSTAVAYTGAALLDADAVLDLVFGATYTPSGTVQPVTVALTGSVSADYVSGHFQIEYAGVTYLVEAARAPRTAEAAAASVMGLVQRKDWAALYAALYADARAAFSEAAFISRMDLGSSTAPTLLGYVVVPGFQYPGEPSPGWRTATGFVTTRDQLGTTITRSSSSILMVLEQNVWKLISIDEPVPVTNITPILECVANPSPGHYVGKFGYNNPNAFPVGIAIGEDNKLTPNAQNGGQPTVFQPGRQQSVFELPFSNGTQTWHLNGLNAQAKTNSPRC